MSPLLEIAESYRVELMQTRDALMASQLTHGSISVSSQCRLNYLHNKIDWIEWKMREAADEES